ncbi:amino acid racemase [Azorhizobium sp. AG788]|uniref:aspartate/glutamate racemase family protein n=1 Tax=Azorhizobium sp. AG788 TaxID=2183897 RepID=UPI003138BDD1
MLGVLGGMGPLATVDFMEKVIANTPAGRDQDHLQMIICSATEVPDRTEAIIGQGADPLPAMLEALRRLHVSGASCVAIPCNTAHHWYDALQAEAQIPILHIVDAVVEDLRRRGIVDGRIGLLATTGTVRAAIYQRRLPSNYSCVVPAAQDEVMRGIRHVKAGRIDDAAGALTRQAEDLLSSGCSAVALACTEIPIALAQAGSDLRPHLIDATDALARACIARLKPGAPRMVSGRAA